MPTYSTVAWETLLRSDNKNNDNNKSRVVLSDNVENNNNNSNKDECWSLTSSIGSYDVNSLLSYRTQFFDAHDEDFSSDGSTPRLSSHGKRLESELRAARLSLLDEIEKCKTTEEVVHQMYSQWQKLGNLVSQIGLTFPPPPDATSAHLDMDSLEQLCQEFVVTCFVSEAIGRAEAIAEAELDAEAIIQSKDQEISRLSDKLRYYEAVNHEMCQRNQEVLEVAHMQRQRKKSQRRWLWSYLGLSMVVGSSVIAYLFLPQTEKPQPLGIPDNSSDASYISLD